MANKIYETERLLIRPTFEDDAEFIFNLLNTPKWLKYIGDRNVKSVKDAADYIQNRMLPQLERLGFSNNTVIRKVDGKKIGTCGLYDRDGVDGIDIGFAFLPEYEGKGYAYESSKTIRNAAFDDFNINTINAYTTKDNLSSQKLLDKLGLKLIKTTKLPDDNEELLLYQIKKSSF